MALSGELPQRVTPAVEAEESEADSDALLVGAARQGDERAWRRLVQANQEAVFRLAYLMLGRSFDAADAEDVAQEVFVRAYLNLDQFDRSRPLRPWLLGITANLARNRRRSAGRYWAALQRWWQHNEPEPATHATHELRSEARALWQAVQKLNQSAQEVLYLCYFLELTEAEMALALDVAPGTVKSRLYRARRQLRAVIAREFPVLYDEWQGSDETS